MYQNEKASHFLRVHQLIPVTHLTIVYHSKDVHQDEIVYQLVPVTHISIVNHRTEVTHSYRVRHPQVVTH